MKNWFAASIIVACIAAPCVAQAAVIRGGTVSSPQGSFGGAFDIQNAGNQSGLSQTYVSGTTDFATFVATTTHASPGSTNSGFTNSPSGFSSPQQFTLDLGSTFTINGLAFWATDNVGSVSRFDLYSDTDANFANGGLTLLGSFTAVGSNGGLDPAQVFSFAATSSRYFQINALSAVGGTNLTDGIGELAVRQAAAVVPEPDVVSLIGLGLLGAAFSRRRTRSR